MIGSQSLPNYYWNKRSKPGRISNVELLIHFSLFSFVVSSSKYFKSHNNFLVVLVLFCWVAHHISGVWFVGHNKGHNLTEIDSAVPVSFKRHTGL